ncbi:hypothetical protein [Haemophilus influenzae]|nr:hypothetical protein [Haemophilus influenzae]
MTNFRLNLLAYSFMLVLTAGFPYSAQPTNQPTKPPTNPPTNPSSH